MSKYVVRGKDNDGTGVYADDDGDGNISLNANEGTMVADAPNHPALDVAAGMRAEMVRLGCTDVRIFSVSDDGTETPLPTYEEALAALAELREKGRAILPWLDHGPREMDPDECLRMNIAKHAFRAEVSK